MKTPDFTAAQFVTVIGAIVAVAVSFGLSLKPEQRDAILALAALVGSVLVWADVQIRKHRAENADKIDVAKKKARK